MKYPPWWVCRLHAAYGITYGLFLSVNFVDPLARILAVVAGLCWAKGWAMLERKPVVKKEE